MNAKETFRLFLVGVLPAIMVFVSLQLILQAQHSHPNDLLKLGLMVTAIVSSVLIVVSALKVLALPNPPSVHQALSPIYFFWLTWFSSWHFAQQASTLTSYDYGWMLMLLGLAIFVCLDNFVSRLKRL